MNILDIYQVNFLPWRQKRITQKKYQFIAFTIAIVSSILMVYCFLIIFQNIELKKLNIKKQHYQQQQNQIQQLKLQLAAKQQQLGELIVKKHTLDKYNQSNQTLLTLLQALPSITPSKSWLHSFNLFGNQVEIKASSYHFQDINQLTHRLENSQLISDVQLNKFARVKNLNHLHLSAKHQGDTDE